jgi:ribonuclease BN (tRNA processing enzyme)
MKIHFLGTNGWYDTDTGNTTCALIDARDCYIILDAGNGIYKADKFIRERKPIYLFISHFHLDHIIGLHILNKFHFKQGLHICGQRGTKKILSRLIDRTFTADFKQIPFRVKIHDLSEGVHYLPFRVECRFLVHVSKCLGYRFKLEDKIVAYCTDTGFCNNAVALARGADLLIAECSYKTASMAKKWPHLDPRGAARVAKEAKAKRLVMTHFDAEIYRNLKDRSWAQARARDVFKNTLAARDGMVVEV